MDDGLTLNELRQAAKDAGYPQPDGQVKTYHQQGLIQRPKQVWRPGEPGSDSVYPPGTLAQLIAVSERHAVERRYDELRLNVWWDGYWVEPSKLRATLSALLDDAVGDIRVLRRQHPDPFDAADALIAEARRQGEGEHPFFKLVLKRLGGDTEDLWSVVHAVFLLAFGGEPEWDPHDPNEETPSLRLLVGQAMGLERATSDRPYNAAPWLPQLPDVASDLRQLRDAGLFEVEHPGRRIIEADDDRLEQARTDAVLFVDTLGVIAEAAEILLRRDIGGLGTFVSARRGNRHYLRASLVRACLIFRELLPAENFDTIAAAAPRAALIARGIVDFTTRYRGYRRYLKNDLLVRLSAMPAEARDQFHKTAREFVNSRPELAAIVSAD
jgi:hypothetical protein